MAAETFQLRASLPALALFNEQLCERLASSPPGVTSTILLLLDELLTNVIKYGHPDGRGAEHEISVRIYLEVTGFTIEVVDDGAPFDPTAPQAAAAADSESWEDRPVGGWGLQLVRQMVDELAYRREQSLNKLILHKRFPPEDGGDANSSVL